MNSDIDRIIDGLSEAQRRAIIDCVDALSFLAGEGLCCAEDAIFELFTAFGGDPELDYEQWVRARLLERDGGE